MVAVCLCVCAALQPLIYPEMYSMKANHVPCIGPDCAPPKPIVSHEMGNFGTYRQIEAEIEAMTGTNLKVDARHTVLTRLLATFSRDDLSRWVELSHLHAYASWKYTVEFLRASPNVAGHSW